MAMNAATRYDDHQNCGIQAAAAKNPGAEAGFNACDRASAPALAAANFMCLCITVLQMSIVPRLSRIMHRWQPYCVAPNTR
jgi:hypothetical protein